MSVTSAVGARSLVVGATGQVGAALLPLLKDGAIASRRVQTGDGAPCIDLAELAARPSLAHEALAPHNLSAIYCVGGATDVERCESDVAWAMDTNCYGPAALAAASTVLPFVYFSTEYVFDGNNGPYVETDATNALSVYGRSKLEGERRILDAHPNPLIVRTTVVYGPDRQAKNFLYTLRRMLSEGQTMRVAADQISTPTYNADLARATVELVERGASGLFHISGREILSRYDFAKLAASVLGLDGTLLLPISTVALNQRAPRPLNAGLLTNKLRATLRHTTMRSNAEAIAAWQQQEAA